MLNVWIDKLAAVLMASWSRALLGLYETSGVDGLDSLIISIAVMHTSHINNMSLSC